MARFADGSEHAIQPSARRIRAVVESCAEEAMGHLQSLALAAGLAWASGVRVYAAIFIVGLLGRLGYVQLPEHLLLLEHNGVLAASGIMLLAEFLADKVPGFDSVWDMIHTFIRIPIGAMLAWGAMSDAGPEAQFVAAILGGAISGGTHLAKMGTRAAINTSPEPFSNWIASFGEDGVLVGGLWLILRHPLLFLVLLAAFLALLIWMVPKLLRCLRRIARGLGGKRVPHTVLAADRSG
jgi:hypothetical protein